MKGAVPGVKSLCPKVLRLTPAKPASSSGQRAAAGQTPNCCSFQDQNNSTLFFHASPLRPGSSKRDAILSVRNRVACTPPR